METTVELKIVQIPSDKNSHIEQKGVPLINVGPGGISKDQCKDFEEELGHIPNLQTEDLNNPKTFSWAHRSLARVIVTDSWVDGWNGEYMMYYCVEAEAKLPPNGHVDRILEPSAKSRGPRNGPSVVYGDVFVFKKGLESKEPESKKPESKGSEESERAKYLDIDLDFVGYANGFELADVILRKLLWASSKW